VAVSWHNGGWGRVRRKLTVGRKSGPIMRGVGKPGVQRKPGGSRGERLSLGLRRAGSNSPETLGDMSGRWLSRRQGLLHGSCMDCTPRLRVAEQPENSLAGEGRGSGGSRGCLFRDAGPWRLWALSTQPGSGREPGQGQWDRCREWL
jgi:hypothetical protein